MSYLLHRRTGRWEQWMNAPVERWDHLGEEQGFSVTAVTLWWLPFLGCLSGRGTTVPTATFNQPYPSGRGGCH